MVTYISDNLKMIKQMGMENIFIKINRNLKDLGFKTSRMDLEFKHGRMELNFKEIFAMELKKDLVNLIGMMVHHTKDNFKIIC